MLKNLLKQIILFTRELWYIAQQFSFMEYMKQS